MEKYVNYGLSIGEGLAIDTFLAVALSVAVSVALFAIYRRVAPIQRIVIPGVPFLNACRIRANALLENGGDLSAQQLAFVSQVNLAVAIRTGATIIGVAMVFVAVLHAVAPLVVS